MNSLIWSYSKRILRSHLSHVLLAVSWCFILFVMVRSMNEPMFVDCVPAKDEISGIAILRVYPIWIVIIGAAHFPSMLLTQVRVRVFLSALGLSCVPSAKLELAMFFIFSTIQWLLIGYGIESFGRWMKTRKNRRRSQQALGADSP